MGRGCSRWEGKLVVAYGTKGNDKLLGGYDPAFLLTIPATQPHTHHTHTSPTRGNRRKEKNIHKVGSVLRVDEAMKNTVARP